MKPPNLLFIYTDEQAFNTLAAYGNEQIEMPNLNRLAEQSHVFDRAYVTQPVCTASRSALLTGLYAHTNGCTDNNVPLPQEFGVCRRCSLDSQSTPRPISGNGTSGMSCSPNTAFASG